MEAKIWIKICINTEGQKEFIPQLTFGVSTVKFGSECETKEHAEWYCNIMKSNLDKAGIKKVKIRKKPSKSINCPIK